MIARISLCWVLVCFAFPAFSSVTPEIIQKITAQGVPRGALNRLLDFMYSFKDRSFVQDIYTCAGADPASAKPCEESKRSRSSKTVTLGDPRWVAIIDYGAPSIEQRFFLVDLFYGNVTRIYASHGQGSGISNVASKFSNLKDSRQTSLGIYLGGETYKGKYGNTLRMYGLQGSNNMAYHRDIVMHGAWYAGEEFINTIDPKTGMKFGRLGLSWGCPAVPLSEIQTLITLLQNGGLIMHYHGLLMDAAMSGAEVTAP